MKGYEVAMKLGGVNVQLIFPSKELRKMFVLSHKHLGAKSHPKRPVEGLTPLSFEWTSFDLRHYDEINDFYPIWKEAMGE